MIKRMMRLDYAEVSQKRRGFYSAEHLRDGLERVPTRFVDGYHIALDSNSLDEMAHRLDSEIELADQGFAYEGAGMHLALIDHIPGLRGKRTQTYLTTVGEHHDYIICIGIGFALARLPWARRNPLKFARQYPGGLAGLVLDGYGFHEGFFRSKEMMDEHKRPRGLDGYAGRCFDMGVGRVMWFVRGADPQRLADTINRFPSERQADLWAGLGLSSCYAGSAYQNFDEYGSVLDQLVAATGPHRAAYNVGIAFAAEARRKAANPTKWLEFACQRVMGRAWDDVAQIALRHWNEAQAEFAPRFASDPLASHRAVHERVMQALQLPAPMMEIAQ